MILHRADSIKELKNDRILKENRQVLTADVILELYEEQQIIDNAVLEIFEMIESLKGV